LPVDVVMAVKPPISEAPSAENNDDIENPKRLSKEESYAKVVAELQSQGRGKWDLKKWLNSADDYKQTLEKLGLTNEQVSRRSWERARVEAFGRAKLRELTQKGRPHRRRTDSPPSES
jgi:hypothetical protein